MVEFTPFYAFGPQNHSFWSKTRPWGDPRKSSDKRKVLGAFLDAQTRKNWFWASMCGISQEILDFLEKAVVTAKFLNFTKWWETFKNITFFALKEWSKCITVYSMLRKMVQTPQIGELHQTSWNLWNSCKFCRISWNLISFAKKAISEENDLQNH